MPESRVWIDTTPEGLRLTLQLPLNRLEYGFGQPLADFADSLLAQHGAALERYLQQHVGVRSGAVDWTMQRPQLEVIGHDASAELQAVLELHAPAGADARAPTLRYDAITHEVRTHRVLVFLRNDWAGGFAGEAPLPLGELDHGHASLPIPLAQAHAGAGVLRLLQGGALHIAEGTDHLLFLLLLLLVAPLAACGRRWSGARPVREALRHTAWVVTAFTLGHTATLVLGSTGVLNLPSQAIEVAVALTIVVAAVHAWRPLFARAEAAMALAFGLVHGMAFSASLSGAGLTASQHALALLAFNLGIEAIQLMLLLAVLPPLIMIARRQPGAFAVLRRAAAAVAFVAALLWVAERLGANPWAAWPWLDAAGAAFRWLPAALWLLAAATWWPGRRASAS